MAVRVLPVCLVALLGLAASPVPRIQFTDTRLKNGLRLIVSEEHAAPMFSIVVNYNVGSRDERKGRTGFAHLFEHMMFKGSENVGPGEHPYLMFMNGGSMNGTTNKDRTMYFESLPANQLDLALFEPTRRRRRRSCTPRPTSAKEPSRPRRSIAGASTRWASRRWARTCGCRPRCVRGRRRWRSPASA